MTLRNGIVYASLALSVLACSDKNGTEKTNTETTTVGAVIESEKLKFTVDTLTDKLDNPWGIAFLPDGRILVTEKKGEIRIIKDGKLLDEKIENVPAVYDHGQGGLLDIIVHPDYANNGWIYLSYAKPGEGGGGTTIARTKLNGNAFTDFQDLFSAKPFADSEVHFGSRIVFDGQGHIFFSSGERGTKENAQNLGNHLGKVLRLNEDGTVPKDNPFVNTAGAKPEIWSYGHRNPQGLVYDKATGELWDAEHGPKGGDELNKVEKGKNYGWPVITYGINYDGTPITDITAKEGMEQPVWYWVPSIATCGLTQVTSDKYPNWKNNFIVGALAQTHIARVEVSNGKYVKHEKLLDKVGRVRMVTQGPDGYVYIATQSPGMLLKIVPASN
ncbi:PQQ-dependent sugar dehydrogenase [Ohtaekwangia koreensis]|uniref:Glucose/arabinose dehydrogenase, beta-propeller fold n=1 Tax=Ohtaekwangia koreensis TaxID=688867 RepID=A0A1T5IPY2_9BACT|nr:PQQ-dependent sugar dehydrogenase [Ohtaekwangia koreensis]SKC41244.1 Glucose/arabinose dehydrogenase, beta-propeller fold [Ohtaekwangia koreensis]